MTDKVISSILQWLGRFLKWEGMPSTDNIVEIKLKTPENSPKKPQAPTATTLDTETLSEANTAPPPLLWATPQQAWHSTRVLCDISGLSYQKKNIICACIYQESRFNNNAVGKNKDLATGKVWSTDWGLVQVNDTKGWHIGKGLRFSSVQDVLDHPEKAVLWMIDEMKTTGKLQPWASYTSGVYAQFLPKSSQMWKLRVV